MEASKTRCLAFLSANGHKLKQPARPLITAPPAIDPIMARPEAPQAMLTRAPRGNLNTPVVTMVASFESWLGLGLYCVWL